MTFFKFLLLQIYEKIYLSKYSRICPYKKTPYVNRISSTKTSSNEKTHSTSPFSPSKINIPAIPS